MVEVISSDVLQELVKAARLQSSLLVPKILNGTIVPVIELNPTLTKIDRICKHATTSTSGNITVYTTPANQDFYLTGFTLSFIKDVTCDNATGNVTLFSTIDGGAVHLAAIATITLTAQNSSINVTLKNPIKIDRSTVIGVGSSVGSTFTAGVLVRAASIKGYLQEIQ
jgi:hypothetical protein